MQGRLRPLWGTGLILAISLMVTALCAWTGSCGSDMHKAAVAADSIAASLHTAADLNHSLWATGQISLEERQQVATLIDQASRSNDVLVGQLKLAEANGGTVTTASILAAFNAFLTQLNALETSGVLHLKSAGAQAQFTAILSAIKLQVTVIETLLKPTSGQNRGPTRSPQSGGALIFAALALTPEEIAALIALATTALGEGAALVQKLIAMKGEADTALLADAEAEDAAARKQAKADEGAE